MSAELRNVTLAANDMAREIEELRAERDRFRLAWKAASFRAQALGEGIERVVKDRESYQGWLKQEQAATQTLRARIAELEAEVGGLSAQVSRMSSLYTCDSTKPYWKGWNDAVAEVKNARDMDAAAISDAVNGLGLGGAS